MRPLFITRSGRLCIQARALQQGGAQPGNAQNRQGLAEDPVISANVTGNGSKSHSHGQPSQFTYHSDGHYKATIEDVFPLDGRVAQVAGGKAPWKLGWQTNERNIMWNDDLKMRLLTTSIVQKVAAKGGKLSEEELESRLRDLVALLPAIKPRLPSMKPDILLRLAGDVHSVARKLLELKAVFPDADCGRMLAQELSLMSEGAESLRRRAEELRAFLPTVNIDAVVEAHPCVLSVESFKRAVEDARRLMPGIHIEWMMQKDPGFVLSLQKGSDMIPYDAIPENPWGHT